MLLYNNKDIIIITVLYLLKYTNKLLLKIITKYSIKRLRGLLELLTLTCPTACACLF